MFRSGERGRRIENLRPVNRRRSLSPRHSQHSDYSSQGAPLQHLMNPPPSKNYQGLPSDDGHYPSNIHYDNAIRRSTEDRPGTPTVSLYFILGMKNILFIIFLYKYYIILFVCIYITISG